MKHRRIGLFWFLLAAPAAHAHPLIMHTAGFVAGIAHPFLGLDHLLAMLAVGVWAAQLGGRALWAVPLSFLTLMALGGLAGANGVPLPLVQPGIGASVLVLGLLIASAARLPTALGMILVGVFALCHGHAHGAEMPAAASPWLYGLGFVAATAVLHAVGLGVGVACRHSVRLPQFIGLALATAGLALLAT
jgi:urease accessory protein